MDTKEIQRDIKLIEQVIAALDFSLSHHRDRLVQSQTQLVEAITAESKKPELENGDYGKTQRVGWVYMGSKICWQDGVVSELHDTDFARDCKGNFIKEMGERTNASGN